MTEPAWETTKKSYCCLCFSDLILNFQSYASANFSIPPLSFHSLCFPSPIFLPSCLTVAPATHPSLLMSVAATAQPKQEPIWNALQTRPGQPLITPQCIDPFLFFHFLSSRPFSLVYPSPPPPEAFLFNLSIPQSPGVSLFMGLSVKSFCKFEERQGVWGSGRKLLLNSEKMLMGLEFFRFNFKPMYDKSGSRYILG